MSISQAAAQHIRAAIYVRVSTADQVDNTSLDEQRRVCRAAIEVRDGWDFVEEYADEGRSGTDSERPAWRRMLADVKAGKVNAVVVAKLDRFARKAGDAIVETDRFEELGATLVVVKENIDMTSAHGRMMRTMMAGFAELERETIVARTVNGQRAKAAAGGWPGGEPSFGWKQEGYKRDARPVPDDREREVIRTALNLFVKRRFTTGQVADHLNTAGLHPRRSSRWEYQTVRQTFTNPTLHTGAYLWGAADGRANLKGAHHTRLDRDGNPKYGDPVEIQMGNPPLTRGEFDAIQRALAKRSRPSTLTPSKSQLLTGRLFGDCGEHYNGVTLTAKTYDVYRCSGRRHKGVGYTGKCDCPQVRTGLVDDRVWAEVVTLLGDPAKLESMARLWLEVPEDSDLSDATPIVAGLDTQIGKLQRALDRAKDDYYLADDPASHQVRIDRYRTELSALAERRAGYAALQADATAKAERLTDLVRLAERAKGRLTTMAPTQRREVIEILGVRVQMANMTPSGPESITISGQIDPRLFQDSENTNVGGPAS